MEDFQPITLTNVSFLFPFQETLSSKGARQLYLMGRRNECSAQGGWRWPLSNLEGRGGQKSALRNILYLACERGGQGRGEKR